MKWTSGPSSSSAIWKKPAAVKTEAWVNWNPEPKLHEFGGVVGQRVLALCRVVVREPAREVFDPEKTRACPDCAEFVRAGLTFEQASEIVSERLQARLADPSVIVCRR